MEIVSMKWVALLLALPVLSIAGGLLLNWPPLLSPPGPLERLRTYLTTNVAETRRDHTFPELRPLRLEAEGQAARDAVASAMMSLGWQEVAAEGEEVRAVVVSRLFRFRDDVRANIEATADGTLVQVRSASRVGKGDLAANARHIRSLFAALAP
jgi:uncharacterized protein (DUF1499 family)